MAKNKEEAAGSGIELVALSRIDHDGVTYLKGDTITAITRKQADALIEAGAAKEKTAA
jgi:hypothetical protein